jgi:hypothetical protein
MVDTVFLTQDLPTGLKIGQTVITDESAAVIVAMDFFGEPERKVELLLINDRWKIYNITEYK